MRNASGHKENISGREEKKVSKNMYDISSIKVMLHRTISNDDF